MFALMLAAVTLAAPAAAPPDGTYNYVQMEGGKRVGHYTVTVKRSGSKIDVKAELEPDVAGLQRPIVESHAAVDASTLNLLSYHEMEEIGCGAMPYDLTVNGSKAQLGQKTFAFPGIEHYILDDDHSVPLFLPAEVAVWNDDRAVSLAPEVGGAHVVEPYPMANQPERPAAIPASDRYLAFHELGAKSGSSGLWYNPDTMVVDEVDTATAQWLRKDRP
ncbi:MAG TPA: hypothetical protein VK760_00250 [Candidatus Acidoferrales bacterium]|nr:hypothetical protein [Candidatus Acidoferrales bacterium]